MHFQNTYFAQIRRKIARQIAILTCFPIVLVVGSSPSAAQQVNYGRGPNITNLAPSVGGQSFGLSSGISCPIPSFNIYGFYGEASDNAGFNGGSLNNITPPLSTNASSTSGLDNFGVAAGFSVPIGGALDKHCKRNAKARADLITAKYQSELVKHCFFLLNQDVDFSQPIYNENGPLGALAPCREVVLALLSLREEAQTSESQHRTVVGTTTDRVEATQASFELPEIFKIEEQVTNININP